ncbi:MAG TPA: branched-chain amino acid ABC transporter permease [Desulfovibrio sp.]|jgi:branched-chain amino acid transport system permease protein|uniref:branched-chain amino acid ABC transporter permease n=1 Tax=Desulfovibrio TaxID=872 RepID=UPI0003FA3B9F|nr:MULTISPECIES: branched-chain amino acid ABC transporter permease [Desulfovibrio]MDY0306508.1 branched-chain amino acid ABC transporter permease [Desulfovibrionaceae bacterium]HMM38232.1 branched-chain amino acid ABC transporter permease [Desulfovibrio sp.]
MQRYALNALLLVLALVIIGLSQAGAIDLYVQSVIMFMAINVIMSSSLNLVNGNMGEFSCGHGGFMCVGAYVGSLLSMLLFTNSKLFGAALLPPATAVFLFPIVLLGAGVVAALAGIIVAVPSFKTRGDYLAIITLAVNYIVISAIQNLDVIGGPRGLTGMRPTIAAMGDVVNLPWMMIWVLIGCFGSVFLIRRYISSTYGKGVNAVCQDEIAAEIMSVDTNRIKLVTFMISSGLAGVAGALYAHVVGYLNPGSFDILKSTEAMVMVYLGGMGSLSGSVISAVVFTILLEALRPLQIYKWVIVPLILILLMQFRPEGIMGNKELSDLFPRMRKYFTFK